MKLHPKLEQIETYLKSLNARADLTILERILRETAVSCQDIESLCQFHPDHYERNLISSSAWYDMLVICWRPGQESSVHDHHGSSCAFKILKGVSTEDQYEKCGKSKAGVELVKGVGAVQYKVGELCLAQDNAIHKISNRSKTEDVVTLHIYSPPLQMNFYETESGDAGYRPPEAALGTLRA